MARFAIATFWAPARATAGGPPPPPYHGLCATTRVLAVLSLVSAADSRPRSARARPVKIPVTSYQAGRPASQPLDLAGPAKNVGLAPSFAGRCHLGKRFADAASCVIELA